MIGFLIEMQRYSDDGRIKLIEMKYLQCSDKMDDCMNDWYKQDKMKMMLKNKKEII